MTKQVITSGKAPIVWSTVEDAFTKVNENFTELYNALGLDSGGLNIGAFEFTGSVMTTTDSSSIVIDQAVTVTSDLTVGGDILPQTANGGDLGSLEKPFRSLFVSNNTVFLGGVPLSLEPGTNELRVNNVPISQNITYTDIPNAPRDVSELTDTDGLLNGGGGGSITVGNGTDTSFDNVTEILINGTITEIEPGIVGITIDSGVTGDANIWVQDFTAGDIGPDAIIAGATSVEYDAGGNIIALFAATTPNYDYTSTVVAKFNTLGVKQWELIFGSGDFTDGWGLAVDLEGNWAYVAGRTNVDLSYNQSLLTKIDLTDGSIEWSKQLDFEAASDSPVVDVAGDGNPVVVGYASNGTDNYINVIKLLASDGSFLWGKTLDSYGDEEAYGMGVGPAGEAVVVGYEAQFLAPNTAATLSIEPVVSNPNWTAGAVIAVGQDFSCTVSFTDGVPAFTNIVDRVGNRTIDDVITTVSGVSFGGATPDDDMTIKVASVAANNSQYNRVLVAKYAANGDLSWQKSIEIDAGYGCTGVDADIDSNGNIYVCGQFNNPDNNGDSAMFLFQMNSAGVGQWTRKVSGNCQDFATSIVVGPDDHLYLAGVTGNNNTEDFNLVIAKYNLNGTVVWQRLLDNTTTWTFNGAFWFGDNSNGGSNLAVKNGYVAIAGGFADPFGTVPQALVAQVDTDGTRFATGNYDFKSASFSGLLTGAPTIVDDIRVDGIVQPGITDFAPANDTDFGFLIGDLHVGGGNISLGDITFAGNRIIGAGADSGDGNNYDTIKLVPDTGLYNNDQYLVIDPTVSNHIHIRAGGTQDASNASLILGGENANVTVTDYNHGVSITTWNETDGNYFWNFRSDGILTLPYSNYLETIDTNLAVGSQGTVTIRANASGQGGDIQRDWTFGTDGTLTLPASGDILDSTGVSQTAQRVEGSWTVTAGTNTYSFTVPSDGTYVMWVKGNIANGIITWNATASVTNINVPAIGTQYAWNYTGGGSPILLTAIPDQIRGTAGTISTDATYAGTTSNRFDFTIANTSGESQTVYYGYTRI